ncbi:MAG TPA: hypothetical protein VNN80_01270, partial [Polyangiaceae bacterium]|nr:hypothetical protein [Polyangiaceae bacterium]
SIPALPIEGRAELSLPVSAEALSAITVFDVSVQVADAGAGTPALRRFEFLGNRDEIDHQSFTDDAEAERSAWSAASSLPASPGVGWERSALALTAHVFHANSAPAPSTLDLVSPPLTVVPGEPVVLSFQHRHDFESLGPGFDFDGGVVEISRDGGLTWEDVGEAAGYNGVLFVGSDNPLSDRPAFVAQSADYPALTPVSIEIDPAGSPVLLVRFRVASDASVTSLGWELDDITLSGVAAPPFPAVIAQPAACNNLPLAVLGPDQSVDDVDPAGAPITVVLDGSASFDADGDPMTYRWLQLAGPPVALAGADTALPTFVAPDVPSGSAVTLSFQLLVDDGTSLSAAAFTSVSVFDASAPEAVEGVPAGGPDAGAPDVDAGEPGAALEGAPL